MFDQSFNPNNLRVIYDLANRSGIDVAGRFFPRIAKTNKHIHANRVKLRDAITRRNLDPSDPRPKARVRKLRDILNKHDKTRDNQIADELVALSKTLASGQISINLSITDTPTGKPAYTANDCAESFFAIRHIQRNMRSIYKIKQSNRDEITNQVKSVLNDQFPKVIVKTDISKFYESIPRDAIIRKLQEDAILTHTALQTICTVLRQYEKLSGNKKGLPRGVGLSAYLSELYMRKIDNAIRLIPNIIYYARYVDDIVAVFTHDDSNDLAMYQDNVLNPIRASNLKPNMAKTGVFAVPSGSQAFTYLGYKYVINEGQLRLDLSPKRYRTYCKRMRLAFQDYESTRYANGKAARALLVRRVRFLTTNTKLLGNKSGARVGVRFSNEHMSETSRDLANLDRFLDHRIGHIESASLRNRLRKYSFERGFQEQTYSRFKLTELNDIVRVWTHG